MRALKIMLVTVLILAAGYVGAATLVAWLANTKQAELEQHLVRLTGTGQDQLAELAGITDAMQPVVQACKDVPKVGAGEVIQYLGPPPPAEPAATDPALAIDFDHLSGVRAGRLIARPAAVESRVPGLGQRLVSVLTAAPWSWGQFLDGGHGGPPIGGARILIVTRPTLLPAQAKGEGDSPVDGLAVMQVAVVDAASGALLCRGGLADQLPADHAPKIVEVLALHHLCALGGPELCQVTNRRMAARR